jgi:hypothetical protein
MTRFEEALERHRLGRLSADEACAALGMSGRQFRRLRVRHRQHHVKAIVRVHEYPDGRLSLFDGPRCLARYGEDGALAEAPTPALAA